MLLMLIPSAVRSSEEQQGRPEGWQEIYFEDFSSGLGAGWVTIDANGAEGGDYEWGTGFYTYTSAPASVWATGGGVGGLGLVASDTYSYPNNVDSWLVYGPLEVEDVFKVEASFDWWLDSESGGDWFGWCLTTEDVLNGGECNEVRLSGPSSTWISGTVSMDVTPGITTPVYLAFHFTSDGNSDNDPDNLNRTGAFLDNVRISGDYGLITYMPLVRRDPTPTPTPTPTPSGLNFYDDFSNNSNGWRTHQAECCLDSSICFDAREHLSYKYSLFFQDGEYRVHVPLDCRASPSQNHGDTRHIMPVSYAPGIVRPTGETCIQARGRVERWDSYWSFWGLVLAGSSDMKTIYTLEVNNLGNWGIIRRDGYLYPGMNHPTDDLNIQTLVVPYSEANAQRYPANAFPAYNTLRVRINGDTVWVYINGQQVHKFTHGVISDLRYVGLIGGDWEITPTQIGYDYFYLDEGCDDF
jgi:hypothetical protein